MMLLIMHLPIEPYHKIIITEGNYLFYDVEGWCEIKDIIDLKIYLDVEKGCLCKKRLLEKAHAWRKNRD